ncbi:neuronal acetylcholine receptor subunit alpha-9-like isoform X1 [Amphiura filiformis]|uniref:neuronal acetylcholine receptor subunit alpha-9-like isoform X1 n=1 Tax=Amphiura filiformis TaxID=82378 RepID=UPI003B21D2D6
MELPYLIVWSLAIQLVVLLLPQLAGARLLSETHRLINDLFEENGYNPYVRPVYNHTTIIDVQMLLFVAQVLEMDERRQTLTTNLWITFEWYDEFLRWDPEDYGGVESIKVKSDEVWMPDITLYNWAGDNYHAYMSKQINVVYKDGKINWAAPVIIKSHCTIDVTSFPFDMQACELKFGPWQYSGKEVTLHGEGDATVFNSDGEWDMEGLTALLKKNFTLMPPIPYTHVLFTVHLRRLSMYYVFNLVMPCVLISGITVLGFVLPSDSGEKVSLGITVLLSLTVFLLLIAESMPPSSDVPVIGQYYAGTMLLVSISIMLTVIVLNLHHRGPQCKPVPQWVRRYVLGSVAKVLRVPRHNTLSKRSRMLLKMHREEAESLMEMAQSHINPNESPIMAINNMSRNAVRNNKSSSDQEKTRCCGHIQADLMRRMLDHLRYLREHFEGIDNSEKVRNEWKMVAQVVDRIFLILYVMGSVSTLLIIVLGMKQPTKEEAATAGH